MVHSLETIEALHGKLAEDDRIAAQVPHDVERMFTYHPPKDGQPERYAKIRAKAKELAELLEFECPRSDERTTAMIRLQDAVFWANASIARNE